MIDVRRFRRSILVDSGDAAGHPEFDWTGRTATLGGARIEFGARCPRCVMITRQIDDEIDLDRRILQHVVAELGQDVGVYATVLEPGPVAAGDPVTLD